MLLETEVFKCMPDTPLLLLLTAAPPLPTQASPHLLHRCGCVPGGLRAAQCVHELGSC